MEIIMFLMIIMFLIISVTDGIYDEAVASCKKWSILDRAKSILHGFK